MIVQAESESPRLIGSASALLCDLLSRGVRLALWRGKMLRALHQRRTVAPARDATMHAFDALATPSSWLAVTH